MTPEPLPAHDEIDATLEAEKELVERFAASGDAEALRELIERSTGAKVREIKKVRQGPSARRSPAG